MDSFFSSFFYVWQYSLKWSLQGWSREEGRWNFDIWKSKWFGEEGFCLMRDWEYFWTRGSLCQKDGLHLNYKWNRQRPLQIQKSVISEPFKPKSRGKFPGSKAHKFQDDAATTDEATEVLCCKERAEDGNSQTWKEKTSGTNQPSSV